MNCVIRSMIVEKLPEPARSVRVFTLNSSMLETQTLVAWPVFTADKKSIGISRAVKQHTLRSSPVRLGAELIVAFSLIEAAIRCKNRHPKQWPPPEAELSDWLLATHHNSEWTG